MKESYWGYWLVMLGSFIIVVMMLTQNATTTNTQDYYQLKEVADSAIYESIDYAYFSQTHQIRMLKEVFVENFIRRFSNTISLTNTYKIEGISESDEIKEGAIVTTTGLSDIFPSGILVGNVKVVTSDNYDLTKIVEVTPSVDFNDISVVTVLDRGVDAE